MLYPDLIISEENNLDLNLASFIILQKILPNKTTSLVRLYFYNNRALYANKFNVHLHLNYDLNTFSFFRSNTFRSFSEYNLENIFFDKR